MLLISVNCLVLPMARETAMNKALRSMPSWLAGVVSTVVVLLA